MSGDNNIPNVLRCNGEQMYHIRYIDPPFNQWADIKDREVLWFDNLDQWGFAPPGCRGLKMTDLITNGMTYNFNKNSQK